jgi:hypothetical protein
MRFSNRRYCPDDLLGLFGRSFYPLYQAKSEFMLSSSVLYQGKYIIHSLRGPAGPEPLDP